MSDSRAPAPPRALLVFLLLGALSVISPFAIDMYLPAVIQMARDFNSTPAVTSLSVSSYFIGFAFGQVIYGPFLDRYGRKKPLAVGLTLFILTSIGCTLSSNIRTLIVLRLIQALGGCVAQTAAVVMVRDFFPAKESAKMFSLLFLMIGISPLLAPTLGSFIMIAFGWKSIFIILAVMAALILTLVMVWLPEGHRPDGNIRLEIAPIAANFLAIARHPQFAMHAFAGAFSFAGLFTYVAGSPIIFMGNFHVSARAYGLIFAILTMGFIGGNQVNVWLLRYFESRVIFAAALRLQAVIGAAFLVGAWAGWYDFYAILVLFFLFLSCVGLTYPNAAALALEPFAKNAGSASALLGFIQMGIGAVISTGIGVFNSHDPLPIIAILAATAVAGFLIQWMGERRLASAALDGADL